MPTFPDRIDALVVGAGPGGIAAANRLHSEGGLSVMLVEARPRVGRPLRCAEITRETFFEHLGFEERPGWARWRLRTGHPDLFASVMLDRGATESGGAALLAEAGARVHSACSVVAMGPFDGEGRTVTLRYEGRDHTLRAGLVIAADGVSSSVARMAGLPVALSPLEVVSTLAYRIGDAQVRDTEIAHFDFAPELSPHYFWVIPSGEREANVGLGLPGHRGHAAHTILERMIEQTEAIIGGRRLEKVVGWFASTKPLERPYTDGLMVVGTAARFVGALSGEGIWHAAFSGRAAAESFIDAGGRLEAASLAPYRPRIQRLYDELDESWRMRRYNDSRG